MPPPARGAKKPFTGWFFAGPRPAAPFESLLLFCNAKQALYEPVFLGGEGGIRTLAPVTPAYSLSRGAPYSHLGTSPYMILVGDKPGHAGGLAEREGFEPPVPFDITGFQDRLLKPLRHLSELFMLGYYSNKAPDCQGIPEKTWEKGVGVQYILDS